MITHNICFLWRIKRNIIFLVDKSILSRVKADLYVFVRSCYYLVHKLLLHLNNKIDSSTLVLVLTKICLFTHPIIIHISPYKSGVLRYLRMIFFLIFF